MSSNEVSLLLKLGVTGTAEAVAEVRKFTAATKAELQQTVRASHEASRAQAAAGRSLLAQLPGGGRALQFKALSDDLRAVTKSGAGTQAQLAGLASTAQSLAPAAIAAGVGIGAVALAATATGAAILKLAGHASEVGARFHDLSILTGLSVETLSGLDLQLTQSGSSLESFARGMTDLQRRLSEAKGGNDKLESSFKQLGVSLGADFETQLRQTLKGLIALPDAATRNAVAAQVLGRSYRELSVFLKDTGGDIDAVIDKAKAAGLVMSTQAAAAADEYQDNLDALGVMASRTAATLGNALIPELNKLFSVLTNESQKSGSIVTYVANSISLAFRNATTDILLMIAALKTTPSIAAAALALAAGGPAAGQIGFEAAKKNAAKNVVDVFGAGQPTPAGAPPPPGGDFDFSGGGGASKAAAAAEAAAQRRIKLADLERVRIESTAQFQITTDRQIFEQRKISLQQLTQRSLAQEKIIFRAKLDSLHVERREAEKGPAKDRDVKLAEIDQKVRDTSIDFFNKDFALRAAYNIATQEREVAHRAALLELGQAADARELARISDFVTQGARSYFSYEETRAKIEQASITRRRAELTQQLQEAGAVLELRQPILDDLKALDQEEAASREAAARRIRDALQQTADAYREYRTVITETTEATRAILRDAAEEEISRLARQVGSGGEVVKRRAALERAAAQDRFEQNKREIDARERQAIEAEKRANASERDQIERARKFNDQRLAEQRRYLEEMKANRAREIEEEGTGTGEISGVNRRAPTVFREIESEEDEEGNRTTTIIEEQATAGANALNGLKLALEDTKEISKTAFREFAGGVGSLVEEYVLLGKVGPDALRKLTATVLASLAKEAAVKAIMALADGLVNTAKFFVTGNPSFAAAATADFTAAAVYGGVAAVAAVTGRAAAGNLFNEKGKKDEESKSLENREQGPIIQGRAQQSIYIRLETDIPMFQKRVVSSMTDDYRNGGDVYELVTKGV